MKSLWKRCLAIILSMAIVSGLGGENFLAYAQEDISVQNEEEREEVTYTANETESDMDNDVFTFESSVNGTEDLVELSAGKSYYLQIMLDSELGGDARYTINFSNNSGSSFSVEKTDWGKNTTNINGLWIPFSIPDDAYGKYEVSVTVILANNYHAWDSEVINVGISSEGTCGDNLTWALDSDGTLTISGTGSMYSFICPDKIGFHDDAPWKKNKQSIETVVIENGVTNIGEYAFYNCNNLKKVNISFSVNDIGERVFYNCINLMEVNIPSSVTNIGNGAFFGTKWLEDKQAENPYVVVNDILIAIDVEACNGRVDIPNGIKSISSYMFSGFDNIMELTIPSSVTSIERAAFSECKNLKKLTILGNITNMGSETFAECTSLEKVTFSDNVKDIGDRAFSGCSSLKEVTIPDGVTYMGSQAFSACSNLEEITISNHIQVIENDTFRHCSSLKKVVIPESVKTISSDAFMDCTSLTEVVISEGVKNISNRAFYNCTNLSNITIPNSITSFGRAAFIGTKWLEKRQEENPLVILNHVLIDGTTCEGIISIPNGVTEIGASAFSDCSGLMQVVFSFGMTEIGDNAFNNCSNLSEITIPSSVTNIGRNAFLGTKWLENQQTQNSLVIINNMLIDGKVCVGEVSIPFGVTSIGDHAFSGCSSLSNITIPTSVTKIGKSAFFNCSGLTQIAIPDSVISIGSSAFSDCRSLADIIISSSVREFGGNVFSRTRWLENKQNENPLVIVNNVLIEGKKCIGKVSIPANVTSIGATAFSTCDSVTEIIIPESVTNIETVAFGACRNLTKVTIPSSVTSIGQFAFLGCSGLTIYGYTGSYAETCAEENYIPFKSIDGEMEEKSINNCTVSLSENRLYYDGTAKRPEITLSYDGMSLVLGTDYLIRYLNNINAGVATAHIEGIGQYTGTRSIEFTIYKATPTLRFASANVNKTLGDAAFTNKLTVSTDGKVTYSSSNPSVATVNESSGLVTLKGTGTATITANAAEGQNYTSKSIAYKLTVSQLPFADLSSLTYNFSNSSAAFGYASSYYIPLSSYQMVFSDVRARELYDKDRKKGETWGGSCFGMSVTSGIFNLKNGDMDVSDFNAAANKVSDLKVADINRNLNVTLRAWIEAMQVSWYDAGIQKCWWANVGSDNLGYMCETIKKGVPVVIYVSGSGSAHAVVGYKVEKRSSRETYLYVYDPNFPKKTRYLTLGTDSKGNFLSWYYYMNDREEWGSDYDGKLSFITPDYYYGVWKSAPRTKQSEKSYGYMAASQGGQFESDSDDINMLVTNSDKFTIQDDEGNVVAKVQDGQLSSANTDIYQYQPLDYIDRDENVLIYLPTDSYVIQNIDDSIGKLEIDMVNTDQRACVVTSADNIAFHVDDRKEQNVVSIQANDGDSYDVMLDSSLENAKNMEEITVSGTAAKNTIEVGMTEDGCVLKNCTDVQMKINGKEPGSTTASGQADISKAEASLEYASCDYDGNNKEPGVVIKDGSSVLKKGTDYIVVYRNNIEPGTATATAYGIASYAGKISMNFTIKGKNSNAILMEVKNKAKKELGEYKKPGDYREAQKKELIKAIAYGRNAIDSAKDEASVKKALSDAKAVIDRIKTNAQLAEEEGRARINVSGCKAALSRKSYIYDGRKKEPTVTIKAGQTKLIKNTDYTVSYKNNVKVGTASIVISGKGKYTGIVTLAFKILPKGTSISGKIVAKSRGFTVKWKKQRKSTSGYQIQYSTSRRFAKKTAVTKTVKKNSTTKLTVKKLKAKKKYYVRIRTYKTVGGKKYYSSWSKCQMVETRK